MAHLKLSKKVVDSINPPALKEDGKPSQEFYRDTELTGFGLKVTNTGNKTYIVETRINGKPKRMTLGKHGHLTAEQARKQAQILLGEIAQGNDPVADKREKKIQA
ncbi:MAG: Arm DNA-binding domain-containing protein, partial [Cycloclasticus sp.]